MKALIFDTETTGFPHKNKELDHKAQPHIVQIAGLLAETKNWQEISSFSLRLNCPVSIPAEAAAVHGITDYQAADWGIDPEPAIEIFKQFIFQADVVVAHNMAFDEMLVKIALARLGHELLERPKFCTMLKTMNILNLPGQFGQPKWPKLSEAYKHVTGQDLDGAHDAMVDVRGCLAVYRWLCENHGALAF